ncbi:MAG: hypothetical protein KTR31_26675 [Myxococcales bacterium]|nr:hypothetical protein [Myxococcales bacterium]
MGIRAPWTYDDTFVGRSAELRAISLAFDEGGRLVSLVGMGGAGKTRLALQWATEQAELDTIFLDLTAAEGPEDVVTAVARALGPSVGLEQLEQVGERLAELGRVLLVLDGIEHVADVLREQLPWWGRHAEQALFLVTTRVRMGLATERPILVGPLGREDSLTLLIRRARAQNFRFDDQSERPALEDVAAKLEGIPLAIELAAARLQTLSAGQLRDRLADRLAVLRSSNPDADPRHATLEATLDSTWALLTDAERATLAQCTVFGSPFTVAAAEAVVDPGESEPVPTLDLLQRLVENGLLRRVRSPAGPSDRVGMLDVVRSHAATQLSEAEARAAQTRHTAHYVGKTAHLRTPEGLVKQLLDRVDRSMVPDADHLEAIVRRRTTAVDDRVEAALTVLALLGRQGPAHRIYRVLTEARALVPDGSLQAARLDLALSASHRYFRTERPNQDRLVQGIEVARAADETSLAAQLLYYRGRALRQDGQGVLAGESYQEALTLARASGSEATEALCAQGPAIIALWTRPMTEGLEATERVLQLSRTLGYQSMLGAWLYNRCCALYELGRLSEAWLSAQEAVALQLSSDSPALAAQTLLTMVEVAIARRRSDEARLALGQARRWSEATALGPDIFGGLNRAEVWVALAERRVAEAESWGTEWMARGDPADQIAHSVTLWWRGMARLLQGDDESARSFLDEAIQLMAAWHENQTDLSMMLGFRALANARLGNAEQARRDLRDARKEANRWAYVRHLDSLDMIAHALSVVLEDDADASVADGARLALATFIGDVAPGGTGLPPAFLEARVASRLLENALSDASPDHRTLLLGRELAWARVGHGARVDLSRRPMSRRLLAELVRVREAIPGGAVPKGALLEIGWPGDRARPDALDNRLWAALSKLKRAGLDVIERTDDGYRIPLEVHLLWPDGR